jgi:hypothetical protein
LEWFDEHCYFANDMELDAEHVVHLKIQVKEWKPDIPYYVYKLSEEDVDSNIDKMVRYDK